MPGTALITGGTGGLGTAVTARFLDEGWRVVVPVHGDPTTSGAPQRPELHLVPADLMDADSVAECVALAAAEPQAPLSAVVNLVGGFAQGGRVHETPVEDFEAQLRLNLRPAYLVCHAAIPHLLAAGGGAIVCVSSRAALRPFPGAAGYVTSKAAVLAFVDAMAAEYHPGRHTGQRDPAQRDRHPGQPRSPARCGPQPLGLAGADRRHRALPLRRGLHGGRRRAHPRLRAGLAAPSGGLMRAVVYTQCGGPEVLRLVERDTPEPGPGELLVQVHVSGVNPTDWKSRRGGGTATSVAGVEQVPNQDGAGVVTAVGPGVDTDRIGQRVWLWEAAWQRRGGTAQEYLALPERQAVPLPDSASLDLGAALGIPALTAHRCLTVAEGGPPRLAPGVLAGRRVLVTGGAGAVGNAAIQLARWAGANVLSTVSTPEKARLATAAGARDVVD